MTDARSAARSSRRRLFLHGAIALGVALAVVGVVGVLLPGVSVRSLVGVEPLTQVCDAGAARLQLPLAGAAGRHWQAAAALPVARDEVRAMTVGDRVYVGSGLVPKRGVLGGLASLDELYAFDPAAGTYTRVPPLPVRLDHPALAARGGSLYVFGGWSDGVPSGRSFRLTPAGRWQELSPLGTPRAAAAAAAVGGKIYVAGGVTVRHDRGTVSGAATLEVYDVARNRWARGADMPTPRHHHAAVAVDGVVTVVGGRDGSSFSLATVEQLDTRTGHWTTARPLPVPVGGVAATAAGGRVVVAGGGDDAGGWVTPASWALAADGSWERLPDLAVARHGHGMAAVGRDVYVFGGSPCAGYGRTATVEHLLLG